jgi:hypothetical protein
MSIFFVAISIALNAIPMTWKALLRMYDAYLWCSKRRHISVLVEGKEEFASLEEKEAGYAWIAPGTTYGVR